MFFLPQVGGSGPAHSPFVFEAETETLVAAFTTPPTADRKLVINALISALKTGGVWDDLDVMYVLAAADSQAARLNWKNPAVKTLSAVNSPTFTADRGYTGNGTSSRLDTGWTPSTDGVRYTQNDASIWVRPLSDGQSAAYECGRTTAPRADLMVRSLSNLCAYTINDGTQNTAANSVATGLFGSQRRASNDKRAWKNGSQLGSTQTTVSTGLPSASLWICGSNSSSFSTRQIAFFAAGASLSGKEAALYNAELAYMQAVGAA